jgi:RecA/RadA recombinase
VAAGRLQLPQQQATAGQPVRLAPRPPVLVGREELLAALDARLAAGDGHRMRTVSLCGLGGAGKTSVALEYVYRHLAEVGVAWQFLAEDTTVLAAGFAELAAQLGARGLADTRDPVASVHAILARSPAPWLLIFDNVADMASVSAFLPPAGHGRVLITSQNPAWPGQMLEIPVLEPDAAAGFLLSRTGDPDRHAARDLADQLGGLPLALEQAAAYMTAIGDTLAGYLALFRQRRGELLARGEPMGYSKTVASTWTLAFDCLRRTAPSGVGLLRLLAFCAPEEIPLRLLLQPRPGLAGRLGDQVFPVLAPLLEDRLAAGDAIGALRRYSLVTRAGDGSVSVHRLVQAVTADQMPAGLAREWQQAAATLIADAIPADTAPPRTWSVCAALLPHAQAALADDSNGMARIADYLGATGSYAAARDLQRRVLNAREQVLGPEHPDTLTARANLAVRTGQAGDAAGARDLLAALLPACERVLGAEHPDTLRVRRDLAFWTGAAGDLAGARDQSAALLPVRERVLGTEHPDTLDVRARLAAWTGWAGDWAAARDQFAALLPVRERVLGAEHPDTLVARHELAYWTGKAGDAAAARDQFAALLPVRERVLGAEHPDTLLTHADLAAWTGWAGDWAAARDQFAALLPVRERVSGAEHPDTLVARSNLARWTGKAGDAAGARDQFAALLPVMERVLGPEHPETLSTRASLAYWTGQVGRDKPTQ